MDAEKVKIEIVVRCEECVASANIEKLDALISYGFFIIYKQKNYIVLKKNGHKEALAWNFIYPWKTKYREYHTHLNSAKTACCLVDAIINNQLPHSRDKWILKSFSRLADESYKYKQWVDELLTIKKNKTKVPLRKRP